nr:RNA-binding protein Lupus La [Tanacetum cinerariifolium]
MELVCGFCLCGCRSFGQTENTAFDDYDVTSSLRRGALQQRSWFVDFVYVAAAHLGKQKIQPLMEHALLTTEKPTNGLVRLDLDLENDDDYMITDAPSVRDLDNPLSNENLVRDTYLRQNMDEQGWISVSLIAGFKINICTVSARYCWDPREVTLDIVAEMRWFRSPPVTKNYNVSLLERNKFIYGILTTWVVNLRVLKHMSYNENEASPDSTDWNRATSERRSDIWLDVKRCVVIKNTPECVVEINTTNRGERCDDFSFIAESSSNRRANYCYSCHLNQGARVNSVENT